MNMTPHHTPSPRHIFSPSSVEDVEETDIPTADSIKFYDLFSLDSTSKLQVQRCDETAPDDYDDAQAAIEFVRDLENGDPVAIGMATKLVRAVNMTPHHTPSPWHIAWCKSGAHIYDQGTIAVVSDELIAWKANARLIAAAPDMLAALQAIGSAIERGDPQDIADAWHFAQRVIAPAAPPRKEITKGHIFKAAGLYLCEWPDEWTEGELLAALRNEDYENITICEAHEMQPMEDIAQWIEDAARTFS
jgi:hypothetical protein